MLCIVTAIILSTIALMIYISNDLDSSNNLDDTNEYF